LLDNYHNNDILIRENNEDQNYLNTINVGRAYLPQIKSTLSVNQSRDDIRYGAPQL